ncbi:MAG TPA: glycoside hydrolase family 27 protein [Terracidiphilus sp.]|nr:glycoside hydrolase family 27 protein [Terracidiphilus sp.]
MRVPISACLVLLALITFTAKAQTAPAPASRVHKQAQRAVPAYKKAQAVALTPPMGWNSWNFFARKVTDQDIRNAADQMVATGMKDAGYVYINIDDTWEGDRDANGVLHSNSKFPDMKALADYVHSKGLKLGIYSSPGPKTCAGYEASLDHEVQDAQLYASWGIDYLKYDLCSFIPAVMQKQAPDDKAQQMRLMIAAYKKMDEALRASGRPMVYSLCQYGWDAVWEWGPEVGANLWRTTGDIKANWNSIYTILNEQAGLAKYAGPGHWNDPDMLEVGNGKLTPAENRTHFSMWAMLAAPLLAGNDLTHMTPEVLSILTNRDVIAIDQDRLGQEATRAYSDGEVDVWTRHLAGGAIAIAVINAGSDRYSTHPFHLSLTKLGLHGPQKGKDLWAGKEITLTDNMPLEIASHDILLVRIPQPK